MRSSRLRHPGWVDAGTLSGMLTVNTPNRIQYIADVSNGDVLLATRPMNELSGSSSGGLAIFYGPPSAVAERTITQYQQATSGGGSLTFLVDGTPYVLGFAMLQTPDAGEFGEFTLVSLVPAGGTPLSFTLRKPTPDALPSDLAFTCLP